MIQTFVENHSEQVYGILIIHPNGIYIPLTNQLNGTDPYLCYWEVHSKPENKR